MRYGACVFLLAANVFAQYDTRSTRLRIDKEWAEKNEISAADVRAIRMLAGILDTTANAGIFNLDAISLRHRNHILLVEMSNGRCLRVHVVERRDGEFKLIWSLTDPPETRWTVPGPLPRPGRGICRKAARPPSAYATAAGRIVLELPVHSDAFQRSIPVETYTFAWDGSKYALVEDASP